MLALASSDFHLITESSLHSEGSVVLPASLEGSTQHSRQSILVGSPLLPVHGFPGVTAPYTHPLSTSPNNPFLYSMGGFVILHRNHRLSSSNHLRSTGEMNCCCSVTKSCLTLCSPMDCSTPSSPVLHHPQEFAQTHVHGIHDAVQPSHPLSPLLLLPSIFPTQLSSSVSSSHQVA